MPDNGIVEFDFYDPEPQAPMDRLQGIAGTRLATQREVPTVVFKTKEQQVAELMRERILSGFFARGQKLKQAELARMFNLSITPVREALKLLEAEGYVQGNSHRGAVVAPLVLEQVEELFELRMMLETRLAYEAVKRATPAAVEALVRINEEMMAGLEANDMFVQRENNYRLHFRLYEMAEQPQTLHFVRVVWAKYPFEMLAVMPRRPAGVIDEHQVILEALASGDAKSVARAVGTHIESGHRQFKKHYANELKKVVESNEPDSTPRVARPSNR